MLRSRQEEMQDKMWTKNVPSHMRIAETWRILCGNMRFAHFRMCTDAENATLNSLNCQIMAKYAEKYPICKICDISYATMAWSLQESWAIAKMTARCALMPYMSAVKNFGSPWLCLRLLFPNFNGLSFQVTLWICVQNWNFVALPIPEIILGTQKIWAVPGHAHALFSPKFFVGFCECIGQICSP